MTQMLQRQREIVFYDSVNVANTAALNSNSISRWGRCFLTLTIYAPIKIHNFFDFLLFFSWFFFRLLQSIRRGPTWTGPEVH